MAFNPNILKAKLVEKNISVVEISSFIGVCETTFYRKMARNGDFSRFEIKQITERLNLTVAERDVIFLLNNLRKRKVLSKSKCTLSGWF